MRDEKVKVLVAQLCLTVCNPMDRQIPLSMEFSRQENWSGLTLFLQGILPTQGLNLGLLHCKWILYLLSHQDEVRDECTKKNGTNQRTKEG